LIAVRVREQRRVREQELAVLAGELGERDVLLERAARPRVLEDLPLFVVARVEPVSRPSITLDSPDSSLPSAHATATSDRTMFFSLGVI
jgi:hypothetical protein